MVPRYHFLGLFVCWICCLLLSQSAFGQAAWGMSIGGNLSRFGGSGEGLGFVQIYKNGSSIGNSPGYAFSNGGSWVPGGQVSGWYRRPFSQSRIWSWQAEVQLQSRGTCVTNLTSGFYQDVSNRWLVVGLPVLLRYSATQRIALLAGPSLGWVTIAPSYYWLKMAPISVGAVAGVSVGISPLRSIDIRYEYGLSNTLADGLPVPGIGQFGQRTLQVSVYQKFLH